MKLCGVNFGGYLKCVNASLSFTCTLLKANNFLVICHPCGHFGLNIKLFHLLAIKEYCIITVTFEMKTEAVTFSNTISLLNEI